MVPRLSSARVRMSGCLPSADGSPELDVSTFSQPTPSKWVTPPSVLPIQSSPCESRRSFVSQLVGSPELLVSYTVHCAPSNRTRPLSVAIQTAWSVPTTTSCSCSVGRPELEVSHTVQFTPSNFAKPPVSMSVHVRYDMVENQ